jgi:hypothetical protein
MDSSDRERKPFRIGSTTSVRLLPSVHTDGDKGVRVD